MKSLNDNYVSSDSSSHETFSDLMFCALIVLVLFILALAIEVSTRVKADLVTPASVVEVEEKTLSNISQEEAAELSEKLQQQELEIVALREEIEKNAAETASQKKQISNQLAAMQGEQRFTGARERASIGIAYNHDKRRYHFVSSREVNSARDRRYNESDSDFWNRQQKELKATARRLQKQRGYKQSEVVNIYQAFSTYKEVKPGVLWLPYRIVDSQVGISYTSALSSYIASDTDVSDALEKSVFEEIRGIHKEPGEKSEEMYPTVVLKVDLEDRRIDINGVSLSPQDAKEILLSLSGRGAIIDLEGLEGKPPSWLTEKVLIPAGYISKTPKLPEE